MLPSLFHSTSITWSWTLGLGTKESSPLCATQEGRDPLPTSLGKDWGPHRGKKLNIIQVSKSMFWDLQRSEKICLIFLPNSPSFQVRKRAVVYWRKRYVTMLLCKWNQVCALTGEYWWEHQTVSKTHRPSAAGGGWLWPNMAPKSTDNGIVKEQLVNASC